MSLTHEFVKASKNSKFDIYNEMKKDMTNNIKVFAKDSDKPKDKTDLPILLKD